MSIDFEQQIQQPEEQQTPLMIEAQGVYRVLSKLVGSYEDEWYLPPFYQALVVERTSRAIAASNIGEDPTLLIRERFNEIPEDLLPDAGRFYNDIQHFIGLLLKDK